MELPYLSSLFPTFSLTYCIVKSHTICHFRSFSSRNLGHSVVQTQNCKYLLNGSSGHVLSDQIPNFSELGELMGDREYLNTWAQIPPLFWEDYGKRDTAEGYSQCLTLYIFYAGVKRMR